MCSKVLLIIFSFFLYFVSPVPISHLTEETFLRYLDQFGSADEDSDLHDLNENTPEAQADVTQYLRNFQKFNGLSQSGTFDQPTEDLINSPRCGVQDDIKNYHQLSRSARRVRKWTTNHLTYRVVKYSAKISTQAVDRIVQKAFALWEEASDLKFSQQAAGEADIEISFGTREHGDRQLGGLWARCGAPFDGPGAKKTVLAHAFFPKVFFCPKRFAGDVHIDDDEDWSDVYKAGLDLLFTMTHEIGHSLGLSHSQNFEKSKTSPIMQPFHPGWIQHQKLTLHEDDVQRIQKLYGKPGSTIMPKPEQTTSRPISTTTIPITTATRPLSTTPKPLPTTSKPLPTTALPTSKPTPTTQKPDPVTPKPEPVTTKPSIITSTPISNQEPQPGKCFCDTFTRFDERRGVYVVRKC